MITDNSQNVMTERQFDDALACCRELFAKKLHDYGAAWRVLRPASLTDQIFIKAQRIRSLQTKGQSQVGEGILPEFIGIVNYGLIGLIQLELPRSCALLRGIGTCAVRWLLWFWRVRYYLAA